jgi:hypothetical protein
VLPKTSYLFTREREVTMEWGHATAPVVVRLSLTVAARILAQGDRIGTFQ